MTAQRMSALDVLTDRPAGNHCRSASIAASAFRAYSLSKFSIGGRESVCVRRSLLIAKRIAAHRSATQREGGQGHVDYPFSQQASFPSVPPPTLPSGTVTLFADDNWGSERATLRTADYPESVRHLFDGTPMQDQATFIAFNLPVGTVMTLMDGVVPPNVRFCGRCVDLVGTGKTESVNSHEHQPG